MKANAAVNLRFPSPKNLKTVLRALEPEAEIPATSRCKVRVKGENTMLTLRFEARDISALRASINSYLRTVNMLINVLKLMDRLPQ